MKYNQLKQSISQEESRLKSIRTEVDPAQLEEIEHAKSKDHPQVSDCSRYRLHLEADCPAVGGINPGLRHYP